MNPGKLDKFLTVLARSEMRGTAGGVATTYATECSIWAEIVERSGGEPRASGAVRATDSITFRIRALASLTTQHRIVFNDGFYDILSAYEDPEKGRGWMLVKVESVEGRA